MKCRNILHIVCAKFWGGGEQYVYDVCRETKRNGCNLIVIIDKKQKKMQDRYSQVAEVHTVDFGSLLGLGALTVIKKIIIEKHIGIINCHSGQVAFLCALLKIQISNLKFVMFRHNLLPMKNDYYHKWLQKQTDAFICVSRAVYDMQIYTISNAFKKKLYLVYNGIDCNKFEQHEHKPLTNTFVIGYAGRLVENKGILVLIYALANLVKSGRNVLLKIAGEGNENFKKKIEAVIYDLKLKRYVALVGLQTDMDDFYKNIDLFILPSIVEEAFGLVICEAMYCGTPVVSTDSGAQKEIIRNGENGIIVEAGSVDALTEAITSILDNPAMAERFALAGKETVINKFTIGRCVNGIEKVYEEISN